MIDIKKPTGDDCNTNELVYETEYKRGYAIWYPQMGGYVGIAVAVMDKTWTTYEDGSAEGGCIDVYIWHDGEFPFGYDDDSPPRVIHHCDPRQFIDFGKQLTKLNSKGAVKK